MTLIECFTDSHINNVASSLRLRPEKTVLVGDKDAMTAPAERYRQLFQRRGQNTQVALWDIGGLELKQLRESLDTLVRQEEGCIIDLTGGDELVIMAFGAVLVQLEEEARRKIRVEKYDRQTNAVINCVGDRCSIQAQRVGLSVEELISLHGGAIYRQTYQPPEAVTAKALQGLWAMVSEDPREWNKRISLLNEFESRADSKMQVFLPLEQLRDGIANFDQKETALRELLDDLQRRGVIKDESSRCCLEYTYLSPVLRYCTEKAGNVLEVKTLLEARDITENGSAFFDDCRMSVHMDWDGILHDPALRLPETRNEVDVVLLHGTTPLFVSCKNGAIGEEELYKLNSVAARFGGPGAKKMLIATDLEQKSPKANRAFIQRAWDMDIFLVTDAAELTSGEWEAAFRQAVV